MDLAVQCLNELIASTLHHIPDVITYLSRLRNQSIFNFCAIPQVWIGEAEGSGWCAGDGMPGMRVLFWSVYSGMWFLKKNDSGVFSSARGRHVHNTSPLPHGHHTQVSLEVKPASFQNLLEPFFLNELVWCLSSQLNLGLWVRFMRSAGWNTGEAVTKKSYLST